MSIAKEIMSVPSLYQRSGCFGTLKGCNPQPEGYCTSEVSQQTEYQPKRSLLESLDGHDDGSLWIPRCQSMSRHSTHIPMILIKHEFPIIFYRFNHLWLKPPSRQACKASRSAKRQSSIRKLSDRVSRSSGNSMFELIPMRKHWQDPRGIRFIQTWVAA